MAKSSLMGTFGGTLGLALFVASVGIGHAGGLVTDSLNPLLEGTALSAGKADAAEAKAGATQERAALVPFEQSAEHFMLRGEDDVATFTFQLDGAQAAAGGVLTLAYQNAVSVLPDTAAMDVEVNGRDAGRIAIASPNRVLAEKIALPAEFLKAGRNVVRVRARQYHRVDCSLEATYELWTRLDPAESGFASPRTTVFSDFDSLLAVRRNAAGRTDVRLVVPGAVGDDALNEAAPVLQALVLLLNRDDVAVTVADRPGKGPGIDLVMAMDRYGASALSGLGLAGVPRGLSVRPGTEGERAMVVMRAASRNEVNAAVLAAVKGPMADGLKTGLFEKGRGVLTVDAGERHTLREAGYQTRVFSGRLSRTEFALEMPADFYPAEYATLDLHLHAATSPGLDHVAQFLVRVNDRVVKSYPFRNREGEQVDGKLVELPLRAFRPGVNRVELLAEVPRPADAACRPEERDDSKPRFILLDKTAMEVPALARLGRLPDLSALAGKAYPYGDGKAFDLFVDRADNQSAGAALTLLSRLALSARAPLAVTLAFGAPREGTGRDALVVSSQNDFAELGAAGKSAFPSLSDVGATVAAILEPDPIVTAAVPEKPAGDDSAALLEAFYNSTAPTENDLPWASRAQAWLAAASRGFGRWLKYEEEAPSPLASRDGGALVTLSQMRSPDGLATWTVVRGDAPRDVEAGVRRLVEPTVWQDLQGGAAAIETAGLSLVNLPAAERYVAGITDRSPGNLRRLAAAWLSDNFQVYVLLVLVLMGGFAAWLGLVVPKKGVRSDR